MADQPQKNGKRKRQMSEKQYYIESLGRGEEEEMAKENRSEGGGKEFF